MIWQDPVAMNNLLLALTGIGFFAVVVWLFRDVFERGKV
jgi:hypothetical protein